MRWWTFECWCVTILSKIWESLPRWKRRTNKCVVKRMGVWKEAGRRSEDRRKEWAGTESRAERVARAR